MAGLKDFKKVAGGPEIAKLQERLQEFFAQFATNPLLDGVLLTNVPLTVAAQQIEHKLQRQPLGWIIVDIDTQCSVNRAGAMTSSFITLQASTPCNVSLWVF
jgi:hypothetical protein